MNFLILAAFFVASLHGAWVQFDQVMLGTATSEGVDMWCVGKYRSVQITSDHNGFSCQVERVHYRGRDYHWKKQERIGKGQHCRFRTIPNTYFLELVCWDPSVPRCNLFDIQPWECRKIGGCQDGGQGCIDRCLYYFNDGGANKCLKTPGCGWKSSWSNGCFAANSRKISFNQCTDVSGWFDASGSPYTCSWYASHPSHCELYGHGWRNFGYTANEACCTCKNRRRHLGEEDEETEPKSGYLHHGGVLAGISRTLVEDNVEVSPIDSEVMGTSKESCEEWNWWTAETHVHNELMCPEDQAIGTLYQSGIQFGTSIKTYDLRKGYCCKVPVTIDCVWKSIDSDAVGDLTCDEKHSVLTGFRLSEAHIDPAHIEAMKCCALE